MFSGFCVPPSILHLINQPWGDRESAQWSSLNTSGDMRLGKMNNVPKATSGPSRILSRVSPCFLPARRTGLHQVPNPHPMAHPTAHPTTLPTAHPTAPPAGAWKDSFPHQATHSTQRGDSAPGCPSLEKNTRGCPLRKCTIDVLNIPHLGRIFSITENRPVVT